MRGPGRTGDESRSKWRAQMEFGHEGGKIPSGKRLFAPGWQNFNGAICYAAVAGAPPGRERTFDDQ